MTETLVKAPTGIAGFDEITAGGLPQGRTTLLSGGPGSGKTLFAVEFLTHGMRSCNEPGIFVAFEEGPDRIAANFQGFGFELAQLQTSGIFFIDAHPSPDTVHAGSFDLNGMLAALDAKADALGARRIVFDALDVLLDLIPELAEKQRECYRLHQWMLARKLTGLITAKSGDDRTGSQGARVSSLMDFMVDCTVVLNHRIISGVSQRNLRVEKYRGSGFDENELPFVIGTTGFDMAQTPRKARAGVSDERVSSGVAALDVMLGGGYWRGASILITGAPGTAKTTLCGAFAEGACLRGERTLFVSLDYDGTEVIRNLSSVGIKLAGCNGSGLLRMVSARTIAGSAESLLVRIKALAREHAASCIVIDPVSILSQPGNELTANRVAERLIDWIKAQSLTLVCTGPPDDVSVRASPGATLQVSGLADTWINLDYLLEGRVRTRGISVIKSRGTPHSNQLRELVLSEQGVALADIAHSGVAQ